MVTVAYMVHRLIAASAILMVGIRYADAQQGERGPSLRSDPVTVSRDANLSGHTPGLSARANGKVEEMYTVAAGGVPLRVVRVNLGDPHVRISVQIARDGPRSSETIESMIGRSRPDIAINGAYFTPPDGPPIGDIVAMGRLVHSGLFGSAFAVTKENRAIIRRVTNGHAEDWSAYETVLCCGPAVVLDGKVDIRLDLETFQDPHVIGETKRMAVGLTADNHLLLVATGAAVSFRKLGEIMRSLKCVQAMNLDAGASRALYYHGKYFCHPSRNLTNLLLVHIVR